MLVTDGYCEGTGIEPGTESDVCHVCNGSGTVVAHGTHEITQAYSISSNQVLADVVDILEDVQNLCEDIKEKLDEA